MGRSVATRMLCIAAMITGAVLSGCSNRDGEVTASAVQIQDDFDASAVSDPELGPPRIYQLEFPRFELIGAVTAVEEP